MKAGEHFRDFAAYRSASLHRSAYLLCGDWHLADDLVQETLAKAYRHWPRVRRADSPEAYVQRILVNEVRSHWRRQRRAPSSVGGSAPEATVPDGSEAVARKDELVRALLELPVRQRATLVLRYLEGLSEREAAAVLGYSEGTVKSQTSRALATLKAHLQRKEAFS